MEIVTSWTEEGIEKGKQEEAMTLVSRILKRRTGTIDAETENHIRQLDLAQIEDLAEALLDFHEPRDLTRWLDENAGK